MQWQHGGKLHRITEESCKKYGKAVTMRVLARFEGGDTGWLELARWRAAEDGPTFGGLANCVMSALPRETSATIDAWARATFGERAHAYTSFQRTEKEWNELKDRVERNPHDPKIPEECADVAICMGAMLAERGADLQTEIDRKMQINRARKWHLNGDGTGQHVDEAP